MPTILQSIEQCNITALQEWIRQGADPNKPCRNGQLPLRIAIEQLFEKPELNSEQMLQIIELLLLNGADPNLINIDEKNLLHYLSDKSGPELGHSIRGLMETSSYKEIYKELVPRVVKMLFTALKFKISVDVCNRYGETPFLVALQRRNFLLADFFLAQGANPVAAKKTTTVLHELIDAQEYAYIEKLLKLGIDIQATDQRGYGAIDMAHNSQAVLFLLKHGAVPKKSTLLDFFELAQKENNAELMAYLFSQGVASFVDSQGMTALHRSRNYELFAQLVEVAPSGFLNESLAFYFVKQLSSNKELLLKYLGLLQRRGVNLCATDKENNTLLYYAAMCGHTAIIPFLLGEGVAVNVYSSCGETVSHLVAASYPHLLPLLLTHGADTSLLDQNGLTALERIRHIGGSMLSEIHEASLLQLLEAHPVEKPIRNADTLVLIAVQQGYINLLKALHARGISFLPSTINQFEPYHLAINENQITLLSWMLPLLEKHPIYPQLISSCLIVAVENFSYEAVKMLISAGADSHVKTPAGDTLLHVFVDSFRTAKKGAKNVKEIFNILAGGLDINAVGQHGETLLSRTIRCYGTAGNTWNWIEFFIDRGASIAQLTERARCILGLGIIKRADFDMLEAVFKSTPIEEQHYILSQAASSAIKNTDIPLLTQLIKLGLNVNAPPLNHIDDMSSSFRHLLDEALCRGSCDLTSEQQNLIIFLIKQGCLLHGTTSRYSYLPGNANEFFNNSILHQAAAYGWDEVLKLLLQPKYGFSIDLQALTEHGVRTPLVLAVEKKRPSAVKILLEAGANPLFVYRDGKNLLHKACDLGDYEIVRMLINANKIAINETYPSILGTDMTAAHLVASLTEATAPQMLQLLLDKGANVDTALLHWMISANKPTEMIEKVLAQFLRNEPIHKLAEGRLLHSAIYANNLYICELLLKICPALLEMRGRQGRTPLHLATEPGRESIFRLLLRNGADKNAQDHAGHDVVTYLLFHNNRALLTEVLEVSPKKESKESKAEATDVHTFKAISLVEFGRLRAALIEEREFASGTSDVLFWLSRYCFDLLCLFETAASVCSYLEKHRNRGSTQPIHDICLFQLPTVPNWQRKKWAHLFWEHGVTVAPFLHWAPRIEEILGKAPDTLAEVKQAAENIHYAREQANIGLAQLFIQHKVPEAGFNHVLDRYRPKKVDLLPPISIEGETIGLPNFYLKKLSVDDPRGFILGALTACCQHVGGAGEACAMHGMNSPYGGFYVVFKRSSSKEAEKMRILHEKSQGSVTLAEFLEKLRDKDQKNKGQVNKYRLIYQQIQAELNKALKKPVAEAVVMRALSAQLEKEWRELAEGKIVAQCWAWISQQGALVLDSWERAQKEYDPVCKPFVVALAACAIEKHGFKRVLLGANGQTPADLGFSRAVEIETPKDYYDYRDSQAQYLVAASDKSATLTSAPLVVTPSASLSPATSECMDREDYTLVQLDHCLSGIFASRSGIEVLPAVDLATADITTTSNRLKAAFHFDEKSDFTTKQKKVVIQPMLTSQKFWTAWVIDATKYQKSTYHAHYLDFAAKGSPDQADRILGNDFLNKARISVILNIYNSESSWSGFWLVETLRHFSNTLLLSIPIKDILAKKQAHKRLYVQTVTRALENVGLFSSINMHAQTLVKAYCGWEDIDELEETATSSRAVAASSATSLPDSPLAPSDSKEEKIAPESKEEFPISAVDNPSHLLLSGAQAKMPADAKRAAEPHPADNNGHPAKRA